MDRDYAADRSDDLKDDVKAGTSVPVATRETRTTDGKKETKVGLCAS